MRLKIVRNRNLVPPIVDRGPSIPAEEADAAWKEIRAWPRYHATSTHALDSLSDELGLESIWYKDEGERFGLGAFKALGAGLAVLRLLRRHVADRTGQEPSADQLRSGRWSELTREVTVAAASAGNHGRAVAWAAREFGCRAVISLPAGTGGARVKAIEALDAEVRTPDLAYDALVPYMAAEAGRNGWHIVSDTGWASYEQIPSWVMAGYTVIPRELAAELRSRGAGPPTHLFVQAGVGGMAAAVCSEAERQFDPPPRFVVVEPWRADCVGRALAAGRAVELAGPFGTAMGGLACGVVSSVAWPMLALRVAAAVAIGDDATALAARRLAESATPVHAGPSGAAGLAALLVAARQATSRRLLGLDGASRVALIGSEGSPDRFTTPPHPRESGESAVPT